MISKRSHALGFEPRRRARTPRSGPAQTLVSERAGPLQAAGGWFASPKAIITVSLRTNNIIIKRGNGCWIARFG
jgi:hypothetical protein